MVLVLTAEFAVTLKQFRKHMQYMNVLGLADMELTLYSSPQMLLMGKPCSSGSN